MHTHTLHTHTNYTRIHTPPHDLYDDWDPLAVLPVGLWRFSSTHTHLSPSVVHHKTICESQRVAGTLMIVLGAWDRQPGAQRDSSTPALNLSEPNQHFIIIRTLAFYHSALWIVSLCKCQSRWELVWICNEIDFLFELMLPYPAPSPMPTFYKFILLDSSLVNPTWVNGDPRVF